MDYKNCVKCNEANLSDIRFCQNCGTEFTMADDLPPTVFGRFEANLPGGQMPPNFQTPGFQPQPNFQTPNFQQPNYQPQQPINFQSQPNYQTTAASGGGQTKKILLGIGGVLIGLVMLVSGGVKLYRAFGDSDSSTTTVSTTPQNLYSNTTNSSTPSATATPASSALAQYARQTVGKWNLRETVPSNPEKDGFTGATAENQLKYYDSADNFLHVTMADFPTVSAAQGNLRSQFQKFKSLNLKVTPEGDASDNDGNPIGIWQSMTSANGKLYAIYWTRKNILIRVLGTKKDVDDFFAAY